MRRPRDIFGMLAIALATLPAEGRADDRAAADFFESAVRPILAEKCQSCHGIESRKAGLSLLSREAILAGGDGGPAAVPGHPDESPLVEAIRYDSEPKMPPKGKLSDAEVAALTRWVELGLPWPDSPADAARPTDDAAKPPHWAFEPVRAVEAPEVRDAEWPRSDLDRFILSRLESEGLAPSPPASRRSLLRRVTFGLTGLPPTPEEVEAFEADAAPDAYEKVVDRLLASPHHGEHWARHWLDLARYSDTKGYVYAREEAAWVHAWAYRDWVVRALNADLPYDRFLLLQVAADRVADDPADLAAMGFLTLGRRFLGVTHDIIDDRIDVVTRGTLGLTVACARCHDHKFDPIPTSDYYGLYGVFKNAAERVVPAVAAAEMPTEDAPFATGLRDRRAKLDEAMAAERRAAADRVRARVGDYLRAQFELAKYPEEGFDQILHPDDLFPAFVRRWRDALARAGERRDPVFRAWHEFARLPASEFASKAAKACRDLDALPPDESNGLVALAFADPPASHAEVADRYAAVFRDVIGRWEAADEATKADGLPDPDAEAIRRRLFGPDSPCEVPDEPIVGSEMFFPTGKTEALWKLQGEADRWLIRRKDAPPHALILVDREPAVEARVFRRGNPASPGDVAPRRFLRALAGPDALPFADGSGRLELARAIVDPANPLTARVAVNRIWMHHFGAGLVRTPGDFGTRADPPSHPELLDWLAARLVAGGWSLKSLHREIVLSATYRQSAAGPADPEALARAARIDPEARLLWRMPVHRLSFEELRDATLAATGELDRSLGGRAVELFKPPFPARRTLYGRVDREDLPTVLRAFDFANPDLLIPQRSESTVPQQALFFLNHAFLVERARALANLDEVAGETDPAEKVRRLYLRAFQRGPTPDQLDAALALVREAESEHQSAPSLPETARDWKYGFGKYDEATGKVAEFRPLPYFAGDGWQGGPAWPDPTFGWVRLTAEGGHPGNDHEHAAVRRWVAPRDATVRIRSRIVHEVPQGNGVRAFVSSSRHGLLRSAEVHDGAADLDVEAVEVRAGDAIDFVVDIRGDLNSDQFLWAPVVTVAGPDGSTAWDARADFVGDSTPPLGPWEQLAQVLLMSNEFAFID